MSAHNELQSSDKFIQAVKSAEELKNAGNDAMRSGLLDDARSHYSKAIDILSEFYANSHVLSSQLFSNRAAVELSQKRLRAAVEDCMRAIEMDPSNLKAYWRAAKASLQMDKFAEAVKFCDQGLGVDPKHTDISDLKATAARALMRATKAVRGFTEDDAVSCQNLVNQLKEQLFLVNQKIQAYEFEAARNARTIHLVGEAPETAPLYSSVGRGFLRTSRDDVFNNLNQRVTHIKSKELPDCLATRDAIVKRLKDAETELSEMVEYFKNRSNK